MLTGSKSGKKECVALEVKTLVIWGEEEGDSDREDVQSGLWGSNIVQFFDPGGGYFVLFLS